MDGWMHACMDGWMDGQAAAALEWLQVCGKHPGTVSQRAVKHSLSA